MQSTALVLIIAAFPVFAAQWGQWRGPTRDGRLADDPFPVFPAAYASSWRVAVGEGYGSPVVAAGRTFVHSRRDPQELVTAIANNTGRVLWRQTYEAPYQKNQYAVRMAKGPFATPLHAGGHLFTLGRFNEIRRYRLPASETWAVPAFVGRDLSVRDADAVHRFRATSD